MVYEEVLMILNDILEYRNLDQTHYKPILGSTIRSNRATDGLIQAIGVGRHTGIQGVDSIQAYRGRQGYRLTGGYTGIQAYRG